VELPSDRWPPRRRSVRNGIMFDKTINYGVIVESVPKRTLSTKLKPFMVASKLVAIN
jgi:hypothetical protein